MLRRFKAGIFARGVEGRFWALVVAREGLWWGRWSNMRLCIWWDIWRTVRRLLWICSESRITCTIWDRGLKGLEYGGPYDTLKSYSFCWGFLWKEGGARKVVNRKVSHFNIGCWFSSSFLFGINLWIFIRPLGLFWFSNLQVDIQKQSRTPRTLDS